MARRFTLVLVTGFLGARPAAARDFPACYARGAVGGTEMHGVTNDLFESDLDQLWLEGQVGRAFGERGFFAVDAGVAHSAGGIGFTTCTGGLELPRSHEASCRPTRGWRPAT